MPGLWKRYVTGKKDAVCPCEDTRTYFGSYEFHRDSVFIYSGFKTEKSDSASMSGKWWITNDSLFLQFGMSYTRREKIHFLNSECFYIAKDFWNMGQWWDFYVFRKQTEFLTFSGSIQ
jgi:hypothetical protein